VAVDEALISKTSAAKHKRQRQREIEKDRKRVRKASTILVKENYAASEMAVSRLDKLLIL
jgi:hypothetical protein